MRLVSHHPSLPQAISFHVGLREGAIPSNSLCICELLLGMGAEDRDVERDLEDNITPSVRLYHWVLVSLSTSSAHMVMIVVKEAR